MVDLFFYNNIYFKFPAKFLGKSCMTCYVISIVYTLTDHSSRPSVCEDLLSVKYKNESHSIGCMICYYRNCADVVCRLFIDY